MKVLVAIANYGTKNRSLVERIIDEYSSMRYETDIVVLCETPKNLGPDISELVGLPNSDPWSLPFAHRRLFCDRATDYDLFIYTEDDMLITEGHIEAFLKASSALPPDLIPGFVRYEEYPDGRRNYLDFHGPFHWIAGSVRRINQYVVASLSNEHSACYMLTQQQLGRAIASGGYLVEPHKGRYDMLCAAATDPYTQCGMSKVICISHLAEFELYHLSNAYLGKVGLSEQDYQLQIETMFGILDKRLCSSTLLCAQKNLQTPEWDKHYYESCHTDIIDQIPSQATRILSVGCGSGETETALTDLGKDVTVIPLDSIIGKITEVRGVKVLPPDFNLAFEKIRGKKYDAIVLLNVLQHIEDPMRTLRQLIEFLTEDGVMVGIVPNLGTQRRFLAKLSGRNKFRFMEQPFTQSKLHLTNANRLLCWLRASGLPHSDIRYRRNPSSSVRSLIAKRTDNTLLAPDIVFSTRANSSWSVRSQWT
ncbi:class I SAM-dependent methyltransferase [Parahaliea mediterranea]|uniref:Class I SAM-dependent methyltransferase n=1 Tax=Parahaliea mediterranea TaxID=651086 RepID=A0A939IKS7_9GAMM|nr:class I SAM-dependent methyltransferase [Parahaliea mediterranea]MBN7795243.1 class I SAM-dependent methyltransferase [Parahaliea mediterranea]